MRKQLQENQIATHEEDYFIKEQDQEEEVFIHKQSPLKNKNSSKKP